MAKEAHRGYYSAGSYADDRYAWTIQTFLPACQGKRILEVGCGSGALLELLAPANQVVGVDAARDGIALCASRGIDGYCIDPSSEPLPFPDESFDFIICLETMEHMMSPYYALTEMRRVLKRGGRLIVSVPNPIWGHIFLYPGLFEYGYFRKFLEECDLRSPASTIGNGLLARRFFPSRCAASRPSAVGISPGPYASSSSWPGRHQVTFRISVTGSGPLMSSRSKGAVARY